MLSDMNSSWYQFSERDKKTRYFLVCIVELAQNQLYRYRSEKLPNNDQETSFIQKLGVGKCQVNRVFPRLENQADHEFQKILRTKYYRPPPCQKERSYAAFVILAFKFIINKFTILINKFRKLIQSIKNQVWFW